MEQTDKQDNGEWIKDISDCCVSDQCKQVVFRANLFALTTENLTWKVDVQNIRTDTNLKHSTVFSTFKNVFGTAPFVSNCQT